MDTLTDFLGSPALATAVLIAAVVWAVVRVGETVAHLLADRAARRSGWHLAADPEQLAALETIRDQAAEQVAVLDDVRGVLERIETGLDDDRRPVDVPAPRPAVPGKPNGLDGLTAVQHGRL